MPIFIAILASWTGRSSILVQIVFGEKLLFATIYAYFRQRYLGHLVSCPDNGLYLTFLRSFRHRSAYLT